MPSLAAERPLKVFISYSRRDVDVANSLKEALERCGFQVLIDLRDLPYGEEWQRELGDLIRQSDTVIWLLSRTSITSDWCNWEVGLVTSIKKRLVPVRIADIDAADLPKAIGKIQILPAQGVFGFSKHFDALVSTLRTNQTWLKDATRLADRARQWLAKNRDGGLLLRGGALRDAEQWSREQPREAPAPSGDILELILASRQSQSRRQRYAIAGTAIVAVFMAGLAGYAVVQQHAADASRLETQTTLATSDFRQGTQYIEKAETFSEGLALLARAARTSNDQRAAARLWAYFQQNALWVPEGVPSQAQSRGQTASTVPSDIAKRFEKVAFDGKLQEVQSLSVSRDLGTVFTSIGSVADRTDVRVRLWDTQGRPKTPWITPEYDGEHYLSETRGHLSPDGRYLALEVQGWRETSYIHIYDIAKGTRIGGRIEMTGQRPETQSVSFTHVEFIAPPRNNARDYIKWYLLLGGYKGDASVHILEETRNSRLRVNQHRDAVLFAAFDPNRNWLVSAGADATVKISTHDGSLGQTITLDFPAKSLQIRGTDTLTVVDSRGLQQDFKLILPGVQRANAVEKTTDEATACFELPFNKELNIGKEQLAKFRRVAMADAEVISDREVRIKRSGSPVGNSIAFGADIKLVCALNNGAQFSFSLDGFRTELWDRDLKRRLGLPINERMLFTDRDAPQKTADVSLSKDGSRALVRSTLWIPPNLGLYWASVWDVASGMPLTGRLRFIPDEGPYGDIRYAETGTQLLLFRGAGGNIPSTKPPDYAIALDFSQSDNARLAAVAEAVAGIAYDTNGLPATVRDRSQRMAEGVKFLREKLPVVAANEIKRADAQPAATVVTPPPAVPATPVGPDRTRR